MIHRGGTGYYRTPDNLAAPQRMGHGATFVNPLSLGASLDGWWIGNTGLYKDLAKTQPATADADLVRVITDQSGNGRDLIAPVGQRPALKTNIQNGLNAVLFSAAGANEASVAYTRAQPAEIFLAFKTTGAILATKFFVSNDNGAICMQSPSTAFVNLYGSGGAGTSAEYINVNTPYVADILWNGASSRLQINNDPLMIATGGVGATTIGGVNVAGHSWQNLYFLEMFAVSRALTDGERLSCYNYLKDRWLTAYNLWPSSTLTPTPHAGATEILRFGCVTDVHYSTVANSPPKYWQDADDKLTEAVATWNADPALEFVIQLGDFINEVSHGGDLANLATITAIFEGTTAPCKYVLGNHEVVYLSKDEVIGATGQTSRYYSFDTSNVHCVVLDCDYRSDDDADEYNAGNFNYTVAFCPPNERTWLAADLAGTSLPTIVFTHNMLFDEGYSSEDLDNAAAVRTILEAAAPKVKAVFSGHTHVNATYTINGIQYFQMAPAILGAYPANNAYAIVKVYDGGQVLIDGFVNQLNWRVPQTA